MSVDNSNNQSLPTFYAGLIKDTKENVPPVFSNGYFLINNLRYGSDISTQIRQVLGNKRTDSGEPELGELFSIADICFFVTNISKSFAQYRIMTATQQGITNVSSIAQFNALKKFFQGELPLEKVSGYDPSVAAPTPSETTLEEHFSTSELSLKRSVVNPYVRDPSKQNPWKNLPIDSLANIHLGGPAFFSLDDGVKSFYDLPNAASVPLFCRSYIDASSVLRTPPIIPFGKSCNHIYNRIKDNLNQPESARIARKRTQLSNLGTTDLKRRVGNIPENPQDTWPIIIVPSSSKIINQLNFSEICIQGSNLQVSEAKKLGKAKEEKLSVRRPRKFNFSDDSRASFSESSVSGEKPSKSRHSIPSKLNTVKYLIVERAERLTSKEWERVVAIILLGDQLWQFQAFPWKTPAQVFTNIPGFYFHYEGAVIPQKLKSWDISFIPIPRRPGSSTSTAAVTFWDKVDHWTKTHKTNLNFTHLLEIQPLSLKRYQKRKQKRAHR